MVHFEFILLISQQRTCYRFINPLHPNIIMHILLTVLSRFLWYLQGELSNDQKVLEFRIISSILTTIMFNSGLIRLEKLDAYHS